MMRDLVLPRSAVQRRLLLLCIVGAVAMVLGPDVLNRVGGRLATAAAPVEPAVVYLAGQGPFQALIDDTGAVRLGERGKVIVAGTAVGWLAKVHVTPGTAVDTTFILECKGSIEGFADVHTLSRQLRDDEWHAYALAVPKGVRGPCLVLRESVDYPADGRREPRHSPPIEIEVVAPS